MFGLDVATITALAKLLFDGLAILVIIFLYIKSNNSRDKERKEDRDRYNKMVDDIITGVHNAHLTPNESKDIAYIEKQINDNLNTILKETGASRVSIVKYHNGNKDMTGKSFLKMSMTNEVINVGVASMMTSFKDIFRSFLAYWCHEVEENGYCIIKDVEEIKDKDVTLYQYLKTINVEAKFGVALKDSYDNVIGILCIEFLNKDDFHKKVIEDSIKKNFPKLETLIAVNGGVRHELQ